jgi:hypothetical protein
MQQGGSEYRVLFCMKKSLLTSDQRYQIQAYSETRKKQYEIASLLSAIIKNAIDGIIASCPA